MFQFIKLKTFIQAKIDQRIRRNSNRLVIKAMKYGRFSMPKIRKALVDLNDINIPDLANGTVAPATMYATLQGKRQNKAAMDLLADSLDLKTREIFPS